jgi:hypothetical protein
MKEYRAFTMGHDGHIKSSRAFACENDDDAVAWARQLVDGHDIELWNGEHFVKRVNATGALGTISHEVIDGRMVPKR